MKMLLFIWVSMLGLPVQSFAEASTSYDSFLIERVECAVSVKLCTGSPNIETHINNNILIIFSLS